MVTGPLSVEPFSFMTLRDLVRDPGASMVALLSWIRPLKVLTRQVSLQRFYLIAAADSPLKSKTQPQDFCVTLTVL